MRLDILPPGIWIDCTTQVPVLSAACARDFQRIHANVSKMAIAFYVFSLISKFLNNFYFEFILFIEIVKSKYFIY